MAQEKSTDLGKRVAERADAIEREADEMEHRSTQLAGQISDVRDEWERKRRDPGVPGAPEPEREDGEPPAGEGDSGEHPVGEGRSADYEERSGD